MPIEITDYIWEAFMDFTEIKLNEIGNIKVGQVEARQRFATTKKEVHYFHLRCIELG